VTDEQRTRLYKAVRSFEELGVDRFFDEIVVSVVNELMLEEAEASRDYEQRHAWTD
jgi:hypothetical protein